MDHIQRKKLKRKKKIIVAYVMRISLFFIFSIMIVFMICGCIYIHDLITGKSKTVQANAEQTLLDEDTSNAAVVVLDAGHGGKDNGTAYGDILEKDINLSVVLKVKALLQEKGVQVILTRDSDEFITLSGRAEVANQADADLFVSIHCNFYEDDSAIRGLECYYYQDGVEGKQYADAIFDSIEESGTITVRDTRSGDFYVLRNTSSPAVLIEIGYLSNDQERKNLTSDAYQDKLAEELAEGIRSGLEQYLD